MAFVVRVLTGPSALEFLAGPWLDLYRRDGLATPYQSPDWLTGWARSLPCSATPVVLAAATGAGRPLAALALVRDADARISVLSAPHAEYVRPVGPHADDPAVAEVFVAALMSLPCDGHHVEITDIPSASGLGRYLARHGADAGWYRRTADCAAVPLPLGLAELSRATRKDHRRRQQVWERLAADRCVTYRRSRDLDELLADCDALAALHAARRADRPELPGSPFAEGVGPWRAVLANCGVSHAFIATLAVDGAVAAAQLCLYRDATAFSLAAAMDPAHMHLAPGHALLRRLAADLAADGFAVLDLGRTAPGQHAYKAQYGPRWHTTVSAFSLSEAATSRAGI